LLLHQICSIFSVVAPCQRGASAVSVLAVIAPGTT
jgi:hypothetical protein